MDIISFLSLTPAQAQAVGGWAIILIVILDLIASSDQVPLNTPRDWLLWLTQWRSLGLWNSHDREKVKGNGHKRARFNPLNYLPLTGAFVPFMLAVLVGHFYHPGFDPFLGPGGFTGLGISAIFGGLVSILTYYKRLGQSRNIVFAIAAAGLICGALVWPASG